MPTPFELVSAVEYARPAKKAELLSLTRALERQALASPPPLVAATLQDCRFLTARTRDVYARLAAAGARTTLLGRGLTSWVAPGVAGVALDDDDPLVDEWVIVAPVAGSPTVFAATDLDEPCDADLERSFRYAVSHDPDVVDACTRLLVGAGQR